MVAFTLEHYEQEAYSVYKVFDQRLMSVEKITKSSLSALVSSHTFPLFDPRDDVASDHHSFECCLTSQCKLITVGLESTLHLTRQPLLAASTETKHKGATIEDHRPMLVCDEDFDTITSSIVQLDSDSEGGCW